MIDRRGLLAAAAWSLAGAGRAGARTGRSPQWRTRDLEGLWSSASYTELERPKGLANLVLTAAEAEAYEAPRRALKGMLPSAAGGVGQVESEWTDRGQGLARVRGQIRSSWIVEPADGAIPWRADARTRLHVDRPADQEPLDNPEDLNGPTRCVATFAAGAPMVAGPDANLVQIVQAAGEVVILSEKYHDARIVRLWRPGEPRPGALPPSWLGDGVGRWDEDGRESASLVVETAGFRDGVVNRNQHLFRAATTRVVERFTRTGADELTYEFTVTDPALYTQPWRAETTLRRQTGRLFEYACHEGNYALGGMLAGARRMEAKAR
jgi:hypothetical protein